MPQIKDICKDSESLARLMEIYTELDKEEKLSMEKKKQEMVDDHKEKHCFESYTQALDWLVEHPEKCVEWHTKTLRYLPDENLFLSYEQEFSFDGVMVFDVVKKYTKDKLLQDIQDFINEMTIKGYGKKDLMDDYGKLEFVYKH